jgi:type I restriction enzyme S subunit
MTEPADIIKSESNPRERQAATPRNTSRRLPPYPACKPSGVQWLGDVPAHWKMVRADSFLFEQRMTIEAEQLNDQTVFHYSIPAIEATGDGQLEDGSTIDSNKLVLNGGELLISKLNPRKSRVLIAQAHDVPTICSSEFVVLKPSNCDSPFMCYLFQSEGVRQYLSANVDSVTRSHQRVNPSIISKSWIPLPPLPEQHAIAAYLDRETAKIDTLVAKKERFIELLREKRSALISHVVTKGLNPHSKMKYSGVEWLGEVPEGWQVIPLKRLVSKIGSGKTPKGGAEIYSASGIMFLRSQNIYFDGLRLDDVVFIDPSIDAEMSSTRVHSQDVLLNITGASLGRCALVPDDFPAANVNQHVCIIRPRNGRIDPAFLHRLIESRAVQTQIFSTENGVSREGLNFAQISNLLVTFPEQFNEQREIVSYLDREATKLDSLIAKAGEAIEVLREYRAALISAAVTGKVDVRGEAV